MKGYTVDITGIDLARVHLLYTMKGALAKDVAFAMMLTVPQVYACLQAYAKSLRKVAKPAKPPEFKFTRRRHAFHRAYSKYDLSIGPDGVYTRERTKGAWEVFWTNIENCKPGHVRREFRDNMQ